MNRVMTMQQIQQVERFPLLELCEALTNTTGLTVSLSFFLTFATTYPESAQNAMAESGGISIS
jgi:hypothetical protein